MSFRLFLFSCCIFISKINAQDIKSNTFGDGLFNLTGKDSTWSMNVGARMQLLASSNWKENDKNITDFLIRRARLKFKGFVLTSNLKYKIELGLSNRDISGASEFTSGAPRYILDAIIKWNFYKNFELWFGQAKLPGNVERLLSSGNLHLVDRSLLNSQFNIDRDVGFQLKHQFYIAKSFLIREIFAFSQGEGRNITSGNLGGHQYTIRLELLPFGEFSEVFDYDEGKLTPEKKPKLEIGLVYDFNNNAVKTRSNLGTYMRNDSGFYETDISTLFIDAIFKYKGLTLMSEYANRVSNDPFAKNSDNSFTGDIVQTGQAFNLQIGYLFKNNWEITGRQTYIDWDNQTGNFDANQYTLGLSKYIIGHKLKIQTDINYLNVKNSNNEFLYRLQFDIHF